MPDSSDVTPVTDVPDAMKIPDFPNVPPATVVSDVMKTLDAPDVAPAADAPHVPDAQEFQDATVLSATLTPDADHQSEDDPYDQDLLQEKAELPLEDFLGFHPGRLWHPQDTRQPQPARRDQPVHPVMRNAAVGRGEGSGVHHD